MKLIRFGEPGHERPGLILPDGRRIDASGCGGGADYDEAFFGSGGLERLARWLAEGGAAAPVVPDDVRLGPPICQHDRRDRKSTRLNSSHVAISYAVFCLKKKTATS